MNISFDDGFFWVVLMPENKTEFRYRDMVVTKENCSMEDVERFAKEFNLFPWIMFSKELLNERMPPSEMSLKSEGAK
jgi:hypothetical protein